MKGIILAGGLGTRLHPLTKVTNKHLLPVYDRPMIYYPLQTLCDAGIREVMIVTGGNSAGDFLRLLGNGAEFGLRGIYYAYQEGEAGIADALRLCEHFADGRPIVVLLGDNIFQRGIAPYVRRFEEQGSGARILLKEVDDLQRFGVPVFDGERIVDIEEKPAKPKSRLRRNRRVYVRRAGLRVYPHARSRRLGASSKSPTSTTVTFARERCNTTCSTAGGATLGRSKAYFAPASLSRANAGRYSWGR